MKASIIIPTLNRADLLGVAIRTLVRQDFPAGDYEILIVDNGSTDETAAVARRAVSEYRDHNVRYLFEPEPGLLSGRHRGALEAGSEILAFVDDDIEASPGWLTAVMEAFEQDGAHVVGGPSRPAFETDPPAWIEKYYILTNGKRTCGPLSLLDMGSERIVIDPVWVWGLNFSIRKSALFEVGGFHPDCIPKQLQHFQGDGETGLALKLKEKGYRAVYAPGASVRHRIPRGRLTAAYFESRSFYQGVADSYTRVRALRGTENVPVPNRPQGKASSADPAYRQYAELIHRRVDHAYVDGFLFHLNAVRKSPALLEWVLRESYLDYRLPELDGEGDAPGRRPEPDGIVPPARPVATPEFQTPPINIVPDSLQEKQSRYDHTKDPLAHQAYYASLKNDLLRLGIPVEEVRIDPDDFGKWLNEFPEIINEYEKMGDVFIEKCLEHYLAYRYLALGPGDRYLDVASSGSSWAFILNNRGIKSWRLDLSFPQGLHGIDIGADAGDTGLPKGSFTALSLQCAYECFMGDADIRFLKEASRLLDDDGRYAITPLYLEDTHFVSTSPLCDQREVVIESEAKRVWRDDEYIVPFCRFYSPEAFYKRVYSNLPEDMDAKVYFFSNLGEIMARYPDRRIYCFFMLFGRKKTRPRSLRISRPA